MWMQIFNVGDNDSGRCVIETNDGGFALVGYAYSGSKDDVWLVKTDASGNEEWKQMYGGVEWDEAYSLVQTSDGGYAIGGWTWSFGAGWSDFWLVKTDASGVVQWNQTYGGSSDDQAYSMVQTSDGGYALAGITFNSTDYNVWLVKTDAAGTMQWNRTYVRTGYDQAYSLVQTSDGGYAIAGSTVSNDTETADVWLVKTDASGSELWNQTYGGTETDCGYSLVQTSDGGYALAGVYNHSFGITTGDCWLVKTDSSGNMEWNQTYGGTETDCGYSLVQTSDGHYVIAGYTYSSGSGNADVWLIKTDVNGVLQWSQTYDGNTEWNYDYGYSVVVTSDGGFAIAGSTDDAFGTSGKDFWLIKTDEYGVVPEALWVVLPLLMIATLSILVSKKKLLYKH